ncbi:hypothetical protein P9B08_08535 [Bacillus safensis]|uniref:hypothetical protein n=1 Tax=Bacillus TaxID=1386 RepID=UPI001B661A0B|nr:hypothetical protein [Bacillus safensis]MEC1118532.1 hypothetical protein [Bacillus safensis]
MSSMELTSNIINSLAWPVTVILVIILLKKPISELISTIENIRFKDWEFQIRKKADTVEGYTNKVVAASGKTFEIKKYLDEESNYKSIEQLNKDLDKKILDLYSVSLDPRRELSLNDPTHQFQSTTYTASYLLIKGIITTELNEAVRELKELYSNLNRADEYSKKKYQENATKILAVLDNKIKELQSETSHSK